MRVSDLKEVDTSSVYNGMEFRAEPFQEMLQQFNKLVRLLKEDGLIVDKVKIEDESI